MLQKVTQMCFMTSVLMRFTCSYLKITSDKIPKGRMTKIRLTGVLVWVMYGLICLFISCIAYASMMTNFSGTRKKG